MRPIPMTPQRHTGLQPDIEVIALMARSIFLLIKYSTRGLKFLGMPLSQAVIRGFALDRNTPLLKESVQKCPFEGLDFCSTFYQEKVEGNIEMGL